MRSLLARGTGPSGAPADVLTEYDDYRAAGAITIPHARRSIIDGATAQKVTVKSLQVNPPLANALGPRSSAFGNAERTPGMPTGFASLTAKPGLAVSNRFPIPLV